MLERLALPLRGFSNAVASIMRGLYGALGAPGRLLQSFLNGTWLGHSLHAVLVDVHGITPLRCVGEADDGANAVDGTPAAAANGGPIGGLIPRDVGTCR